LHESSRLITSPTNNLWDEEYWKSTRQILATILFKNPRFFYFFDKLKNPRLIGVSLSYLLALADPWQTTAPNVRKKRKILWAMNFSKKKNWQDYISVKTTIGKYAS
jgi:hypothetical protein